VNIKIARQSKKGAPVPKVKKGRILAARGGRETGVAGLPKNRAECPLILDVVGRLENRGSARFLTEDTVCNLKHHESRSSPQISKLHEQIRRIQKEKCLTIRLCCISSAPDVSSREYRRTLRAWHRGKLKS
jgi:hypothetical protein